MDWSRRRPGTMGTGARYNYSLTGVGSVVTRTDDEMSIRDLLLQTILRQILYLQKFLGSNDPEIQEYFGQSSQRYKVHGTAEEQVLYPSTWNTHRKYTTRLDEVMQIQMKLSP